MTDEWRGRRIHFMGVGGIGMSALAKWAAARGAVVSGCDREASEVTRGLEAAGIPVAIGHDPAHGADADLLVYTSAVPDGHPERTSAVHRMRRGTFLARMLDDMRVVGVCGTHGKTTTTWITAHLFIEAGLDPTVLLGGMASLPDGNLRIGESRVAVVELDESDESFLEPVVEVAVITNVESDHLHYYGSFDRVRVAFRSFADGVGRRGRVVGASDDPETAAILRACGGRTTAVGFGPDATYRAGDLVAEGGRQVFRLYVAGKDAGRFALPMPGRHNVTNALCALGAASHFGLRPETCRDGLASCRSVGRRMERVGRTGDIEVYSDYAHHPTEVRAAIEAAREMHDEPVLVVFQPHLYSRTRDYAEAFGEALAGADRVLLVDIYPAREDPIEGVDSALLVESVRRNGAEAFGPVSLETVPQAVAEQAGDRMIVILMGAGDIVKVQDATVDHLSRRGA